MLNGQDIKYQIFWAVFVGQLVERSLPLPEVRGSKPVIGKNLFMLNICLLSTVYWIDENKEKEAGNGPFLKKKISDIPSFTFTEMLIL